MSFFTPLIVMFGWLILFVAFQKERSVTLFLKHLAGFSFAVIASTLIATGVFAAIARPETGRSFIPLSLIVTLYAAYGSAAVYLVAAMILCIYRKWRRRSVPADVAGFACITAVVSVTGWAFYMGCANR